MTHPHTSYVSQLVHSVGKYVSRTARNLPPGKIPAALVEMLLRDLYETDGSRPASQVFESLAAPLEEILTEPRLAACRELLREIDGLESDIRRGHDEAIRRAGAAAIEVDTLLREIRKGLGAS